MLVVQKTPDLWFSVSADRLNVPAYLNIQRRSSSQITYTMVSCSDFLLLLYAVYYYVSLIRLFGCSVMTFGEEQHEKSEYFYHFCHT